MGETDLHIIGKPIAGVMHVSKSNTNTSWELISKYYSAIALTSVEFPDYMDRSVSVSVH